MRRGNFAILVVCFLVLLAEWSAPGQLTFAFPFLTEPWQQFTKVPSSATQVRDKTIVELDKLAPAQPKDDWFVSRPSMPDSQRKALKAVTHATTRISSTKPR